MIIDELRTYGVDIDTALQRCVTCLVSLEILFLLIILIYRFCTCFSRIQKISTHLLTVLTTRCIIISEQRKSVLNKFTKRRNDLCYYQVFLKRIY